MIINMKVLIIEDCKLKAEDIKKCILQWFRTASIEVASAYSTGVRKAYAENYDFIIIDNSLPIYEKNPEYIKPDMARLILSEFEEFGIIKSKCIICSAFDVGGKEAYFDNTVKMYDYCIGYVRYDPTNEDWREELITMIKENI